MFSTLQMYQSDIHRIGWSQSLVIKGSEQLPLLKNENYLNLLSYFFYDIGKAFTLHR